MLSLILMTAVSAVGQVPAGAPPAARVAPKAYAASYPTTTSNYYSAPHEVFYGGADFSGGCRGGCCPTDDVNLFLPCAPAAPCAPYAPCSPRPICPPRVNTFPCPTPIRCCPPPPPPGRAPCP